MPALAPSSMLPWIHAALAVSHPIGMWKLAGIIVATFLVLLGLTAWVGGMRTRRRQEKSPSGRGTGEASLD